MTGSLEFVFPHHAFDGFVYLTRIFGVFFLVVADFDGAEDGEVDELADGHAGINADGLFDGDLEGPVAAEADVAFAGGGVDVNAKAAGGGLAFQEGNVGVGFGVFEGDAEVEDVWVEDEAFGGISKCSIWLCFLASRMCSR